VITSPAAAFLLERGERFGAQTTAAAAAAAGHQRFTRAWSLDAKALMKSSAEISA